MASRSLARSGDPLCWAVRVGESLLRRAVREGAGLCWPVRDRRAQTKLRRPWDLYSGSAGVGLFLGLLGQATGERRFQEAGERALKRSLSCGLKAGEPQGLAGLAGIGQALLILGLVDQARAIGDRVAPLRKDEICDLLYGSAGIGTFLLSLHRRTGARRYLRAALIRGDALLKAGPPWPLDGSCYTGYSHGAAGIGEFFLHLHAESGQKRFLAGVRDCLRLVARHSVRRGARLDTVYKPDDPRVIRHWCHGSPGILLFEMTGARIRKGRSWLERARGRAFATLDSIRKSRLAPLCYCHGLAGNLDMLLEFGWRDKALRLAQDKILPTALPDRAGLSFPSQAGPWPWPGFFLGDAGIGFFFLRLARPETPLFYRLV
jgi:lantibiotic biosynthesis protein